jgi:mono/diheme cytochrome c family protein
MHEGIGRGGKRLYPAFPYPWYTKVKANDVRAIKAYLDTLPAVRQENKPLKLSWPFSVREVMVGWNALNLHEGSFRSDPNKSAQWNRGAYLVEGLGHCGQCHSPKNKIGATKRGDQLEGGYAENWYASDLVGNMRDGLGAWSTQEIVRYLKNGSNTTASAAGPMAEVVRDSTTHLTNADLASIAMYLRIFPISQQSLRAIPSISLALPGARLSTPPIVLAVISRAEVASRTPFRDSRRALPYKRDIRTQFCK